MKTQKVVLCIFLLFVGVFACKYDDEALWNKINDLEERISSLEGRLSQMNADIGSIGTVVNALENKVYVTSVDSTKQGYQITFTDGKTITVRNGENGKDGEDGKDGKDGANGKDAPFIGIDLFDGSYYWIQVVDSVKSWLLDFEGNKIPVSGKDAVTPILKVDAKGYWVISYDRGVTYERILDVNGNPVTAVGKDGADGVDGTNGSNGTNGSDGQDGDSFFRSVTVDGNTLVLVLMDGTILRIPIQNQSTESEFAFMQVQGRVELNNTEGLRVESMLYDSPIEGNTFSSYVFSNTRPQLISIIDDEGHVRLMSYGYHQGTTPVLNAHSSALALVALMPPFEYLSYETYDGITQLIESSPGFAAVEQEMQRIIDAQGDIFSANNTNLLNAATTLVRDLIDPPSLRAEISGIHSECLSVISHYGDGNKVHITNTALWPPYQCDVYHNGVLMESTIIPTPNDLGVLNLVEVGAAKFFGNEYVHYGEEVSFTLSDSGKYRFVCDKSTERALTDFLLTLLDSFVSLSGLSVDFPYQEDAIASLILGNLRSTINGTMSIDEFMMNFIGKFMEFCMEKGLSAIYINKNYDNLIKEVWELHDKGVSTAEIEKEITKKYLKNVSRKFFLYNAGKFIYNGMIRLTALVQAKEKIQFNLCNDELDGDRITCCLNTKLVMFTGNNQIADQTNYLENPLIVSAVTTSDDGDYYYDDNVRVKFEVISGGGRVDHSFAVIDEISRLAQTKWQLGSRGEQKIRAVAYNRVTESEISEPVYFTAFFKHVLETKEAEKNKIGMTLFGAISNYDRSHIYQYGIVYSLNEDLTGGERIKSTNINQGTFSVDLNTLTEGQTYYWAAYMTFASGLTVYGETKSFVAGKREEEKITTGQATINGNEVELEGLLEGYDTNVWTYGIVYSTDNTMTDGTKVIASNISNGRYVVNLQNLEEGKTYYWYAYVENGNSFETGQIAQFQIVPESFEISEETISLLRKLYDDTKGDQWVNNTNWKSDEPINTWYGVRIQNGLVYLDLAQNNLTKRAELFNCNQLGGIDMRGNELSAVWIENLYSLQQIDVSNCTSLTHFDCSENALLQSVDLSNCVSLTGAQISNNQVLKSLDLTGCTSLQSLNAYENHLETLDLKDLSQLTYLDVVKNQLTSIDVSSCPNLKELNCWTNQLTGILDLSQCTQLEKLACFENQLTELKLNAKNTLVELLCSKNRLTHLDISGYTVLPYFEAQENEMTSIDFTNCPMLTHATVNWNWLTDISIEGCPQLTHLYCIENRINKEIPESFSQLTMFHHDPKYTYVYKWDELGHMTVDKVETNTYGWWYLGEPESGQHKRQ